ncbi:single-stranded DNA-binding protein [Caedimonas varicaedens]|jgi:single-strand DNA-binding protein|uniref:Single-stranded DNA-binding protein n=1 Tax=Caedimonas varicaedens TaxID=1629334 RepID=A0A0K8MB88_9PROT|nr:single-stranded DNA-binding protein [Caedimonas varicaedens]
MSLNRICLLGHVGKNPQFYQTSIGDAYARFSLATQESWKDAQGNKQTRTQWHSVAVFSQGLVEIARQYLNKGAYVFLEGMLHYRQVLTDDGREYPVAEILLKNPRSVLRILQPGKTVASVPEEHSTEEACHDA